jgi:hypothetical protein
MYKNLLFIAILLLNFKSYSQQVGNIFYNRIDSVKISENNVEFEMPWVGGLNAVQFNEIDLNNDGTMDLLIFDKTSRKLLTFINEGIANTVSYVYKADYRKAFPEIIFWVLTRDYNCDGKMDLFVGVNGGMAVYKNTTGADNVLKFEVVKELLYHRNCFNSFSPNLYVNSSDVPAIVDLDGDGDLDIVTFGAFFSEAYLYINESKENFGNCDSLDYNFTDCAWGNFSVGLLPGQFTLNSSCIQFNCKKSLSPNALDPNQSSIIKAIQHAGATLLIEDFNGDGKKDALIGHVEGRGLSLLLNGGASSIDANITSVQNNFPSNDLQVDMFQFPAAFYLDVDNDGKKDIIASPNASFISQNKNSVHFYKNFNTNDSGLFKFQKDNLLQDLMIELGEGAYPTLIDYDNDGDLDLFVGNYGYYDSSVFANSFYTSKIAFFENIGTATNPEFDLKTRDFLNFSTKTELNSVLTFGDLDGDGDLDILIAVQNGKVYHYENIALSGAAPTYTMVTSNFQSLSLGNFPALQLFDVNGDGLLDIIYGNRNGRLNYIQNTGSTSVPNFNGNIVTSFGGVDVRNNFYNLGFSYPFMYKNSNNKIELMVGSENGKIYLYNNIIDSTNNTINNVFNLVSDSMANIYEGVRCGITGGSLFDDGFMELVVGSYSGGIILFKGWDSAAPEDTIPSNNLVLSKSSFLDFEIFPNPTENYLNINIISNDNKHTNANYQIVDLSGRIIKEGQIQNQKTTVTTDDISRGIYIIKVQSGDANGVKKFVKR